MVHCGDSEAEWYSLCGGVFSEAKPSSLAESAHIGTILANGDKKRHFGANCHILAGTGLAY